MTWIVAADGEFLSWADERRGRRNGINSLALVESTLEFARFYVREVLPRCDPPPAEWFLSAGLSDLHGGGDKSALHAGGEGDFVWPTDWEESPANDIRIGPLSFRDEPPGEIAYQIIRQIYREFGLDESDIPYVQNGAIDEELIRAAR